MKLVLALTTEVVAPMVTEGVAATVEVEVADSGEENREDTRITFNLSLLKKHKTYL